METLYGFKINYERLMKPIGTITRAHLIREIALSNPEYEKETIFKNYLREGCPGYISSTKLQTADGVKFLKENGAVVVIAHPVLLKKNDVLELINENVDGLEAIYPKNKAMDEKLFREICAKRGMIITAGSDYHGIIDYSHEDLAYNVLEGKDLTNFLNRLGVK
jgi:predicted metal-dependent phosphoesterase TrpH